MKRESRRCNASTFDGFARTAAALLTLGAPVFARAQVMEVGAGGRITTYDGPAVFTGAGAVPIARPEAARSPGWTAAPAGAIADAAEAALLSPDLIAAVAWQESRFRPRVVSRAGAVGEMQLMPATARAFGADARDTDQNYRAGAAYLRVLMRRYGGDLVRTLAAYNAGPAAVDRYGGVPPFKETQDYVAAVLDRLSRIADGGTVTNR